MSYAVVATMAADPDLRRRVVACAFAAEKPSPAGWASETRMWQLAVIPTWVTAYADALSAQTPRPGWDETVISDAMILDAVQPLA